MTARVCLWNMEMYNSSLVFVEYLSCGEDIFLLFVLEEVDDCEECPRRCNSFDCVSSKSVNILRTTWYGKKRRNTDINKSRLSNFERSNFCENKQSISFKTIPKYDV